MQRISSNTHPIPHKIIRLVPWKLVALLGLGFVSVIVLTGNWVLLLPLAILLMLPSSLFGAIYLSWELFVPNLASEVVLNDDSLIVSRRGQTDRITFAQIASIQYRTSNNPPRATVKLRTPCVWGYEFTFIPNLDQGRDAASRCINRLQTRVGINRPAT